MRLSSHNILVLLLFLLVALLVVGCGNQEPLYLADLPPGAYHPDPVFSNFYQNNGGYGRFRHAISTSYTNQRGEKFQFFESVLMVYDPIEDRIYFDDLGNQLEVRDLPVQEWTGPISPDGLIVGRFYIPPAFVPLYLEISPELVGQPLTQPYMNYSKNRVEQHFTNLGLYYDLDDAEQTAGLLNYGKVACEACDHLDTAGSEGIIDVPLSLPFFYENMDALEISISLAGENLQKPVTVRDGTTEVVFDHMAFYEDRGGFKIRPVPVLLGMQESNYFYSLNSSMFVFKEHQNDVGHNVLGFFDEYINQNGGYAVSGQPITEIFDPENGSLALRQCFENLCLDYFHYAEESKVRPVSLGELYLAQASDDYVTEPKSAPNEDGVQEFSSQPRNLNPFTLLLWEIHTVIDSSTPQTISVLVELENTPQPGKELILTVAYPDGREEDVLMPATGGDGVTSFTLAPIAGENGDLVYYEVCLYIQNMEPACVQQSFLIWGNP